MDVLLHHCEVNNPKSNHGNWGTVSAYVWLMAPLLDCVGLGCGEGTPVKTQPLDSTCRDAGGAGLGISP